MISYIICVKYESESKQKIRKWGDMTDKQQSTCWCTVQNHPVYPISSPTIEFSNRF